MPILAGDIKLVASQVMDDVPEGGGAPTATVIQDGASNAIFPDISELDRAGGRVNLRKIFLTVATDDTDAYFGANMIVSEPLADPRVSITLFSTRSTFDRRDDAKSRIEAYLAPASEWPAYLFETHIAGQRAIQLFQRPAEAPPAIGKTLVLRHGALEQYVRITDVAVEDRTFTIATSNGYIDYPARIVTCGLSDALRYDFIGSPPSRTFTKAAGATIVRDTLVADAGTYCGVVKTTEAVPLGAIGAKVDSVFTRLVPSAQTEIPLVDASAAGVSQGLHRASDGLVTHTTSVTLDATSKLHFGNSVTPGTVSIAVSGGTITDANGELQFAGTVIGSIDYAAGVAVFASSAGSFSGPKTLTFAPAGAPSRASETLGYPITPETRSYNYARTLLPIPAPGSLVVSYRSQGRWYDLEDRGGGVLRGLDAAFGAGTISYSTGTASITVGALPDDGTEILYSWASPAEFKRRAGQVVAPARFRHVTAEGRVGPSTISLAWGAGKTATDNGAGLISGDATGTVNYATGEIEFAPAALPAAGTEFTLNYATGNGAQESLTNVDVSSGNAAFTLTQPNVLPGTVEVSVSVSYAPAALGQAPTEGTVTLRDNGSGALVDAEGATRGSITYASGQVQVQAAFTARRPMFNYSLGDSIWRPRTGVSIPPGSSGENALLPVSNYKFSGYTYADVAAVVGTTNTVVVRYHASGVGTAVVVTVPATALAVDLTPNLAETIIEGSVNLTVGGRTFFDSAGRLYHSLDVATGSAIDAGTIDYLTGRAAVRGWSEGSSGSVQVNAMLTSVDVHPVSEVAFRVPVAPLRPGSLQLLGARPGGGTINATVDASGNLDAVGVHGVVDLESGVVRVRFGDWVAAAGNESEPWFSAASVIDGKVFKPAPVLLSTLRYNAVAFSYLPLDADLLGLDPVRLPQDGRVPIFRPGGFAVIGHTQRTTQAVSAGQTVTLARVRLSRVRVAGADGATIQSGYTTDLDAGTVTFADVTGYSQPVTIEDRIEDLLQVSDVQISGRLGFTRQVTHAYPAGSYVSTALVAGDLRARATPPFDLATWDRTWSDESTGDSATGTFNSAQYPIAVTNRGAISERWAVRFLASSTFEVIGEHVGVIDTGNTTTVCAPVNPAAGVPYFTIPALGWGNGWAAGNVLRFNTVGAEFPNWIVRTVQQGPETVKDDSFAVLGRGGVNAN